MDELREDFPGDDSSYVAFLDREEESSLWEVRKCCDEFEEPRRNAKIHKVLPHKYVDTDISIWLDANISLNVSPEELVELWLKDADIAVCEHFERDCIYEEAEIVKECQLDDPRLVDAQMARYRKAGYPENNGMAECGIIVRRHTPEIIKCSEKWWDEICRGSSRDQLSFAYCFPNYKAIEANARYSPLFNYEEHKVRRQNGYEKYYV